MKASAGDDMKIDGKEVHTAGRFVRIAHLDGDKYESITDPASTIEILRGAAARIDLFTFMQVLPHTTPAYSYPMEWDNLAALPVSTFDHWYSKQIGFKVRNKVKKAVKNGVITRELPFDDDLVRGVSEIYNECPVRQGRLFWNYGKDLATVRREAGTFMERSVFIGAFFEDRMIGFAKLVSDQDGGQAGLMHIVSMIKHRDKAPSNALISQAVRSCADRHIPELVYSNFSYGNKKRDTLSDFKEGNGFVRKDVPRYFVPLTAVGHLALRMGLHRGLTDHLPESVIARLRKLRESWYNRRFQLAQEMPSSTRPDQSGVRV
jgi:hypothetical protein